MSNSNTYSLQSQLAYAAYGTFSGKTIEIEELTDDNTVGMSLSQAAAFSEKWQVIAQSPYSVTGLSATVFQAKEGGAKYLAIRGTEPTGGDLTADGLLAAGLSSNLNPQFIALQQQLNAWLNDPEVLQGQSFTVTGHSLGGYLAAAVKQSYMQVTDANLYNAPGVGGLLGNLVGALSDVLGLSGISLDNIWNIRGSEGFPVIAGLGYQLGTAVTIETEKSLNNHSISLLADVLAVCNVYSQLVPVLTQNQLNTLIDAFGTTADSISNSKTLEFALDALRFIALGPSASKTEIGNRDALYTNLNNAAFQNKLTELGGTTQFTLLADKTAGEILNMAKDSGAQGLAARYALVAANPFVLDYSIFNADGALERFDPNSGAGKITDEYLSDRVNFLGRALWFNTQDKNPYNPGAGEPVPGRSVFENESRYFEDATSDYKIQQGGLFANTPRYYFGDNQVNNPAASGVEDHLYGGGGDDTLNGQEGMTTWKAGQVPTFIRLIPIMVLIRCSTPMAWAQFNSVLLLLREEAGLLMVRIG